MISRKVYDLAALVGATGVTRFIFRSHYLYDIDSVNFALGMRRFDPGVHQPHPPGYFLYICLARLTNLLFHNANTALVAISIAFSCAASAAIYVLAEEWFGRKAACFAGLIFLFSPLAWFHGTVALTYIVEAFFSALVGYLSWRIDSGKSAYVLPAALAVGISAGFRPSSLLFLAPVFLFSLRGVEKKRIAGSIGVLALTILAWFFPMIRITGVTAYRSSLVSLWMAVPGKASVFNSPIANSLVRAVVIAGICVLCFGCATLLAFRPNRVLLPDRPRHVLFTWIWIAPGLLFFTFVYLKSVNSGYLLILLPPVCAWMGVWASRWCEEVRLRKSLKILIVAGCAAVNSAIFIFAPVYCSFRAVHEFEAELRNVVSVMPQVASAKDTILIGLDSHFLGYRHAGYYLPDYLTVQFPEVRLSGGMRAFAMRGGNTILIAGLDTASIRNFLIFPLPPGDAEYRAYMTELRKRFPPGDLHVTTRDHVEYVAGPIRDLRFLFPFADGDTEAAVNK